MMFKLSIKGNKHFDVNHYEDFKKLLKLANRIQSARQEALFDVSAHNDHSGSDKSWETDSLDEDITKELFSNFGIKKKFDFGDFKKNEFIIREHEKKLKRRNASMPNVIEKNRAAQLENEVKMSKE